MDTSFGSKRIDRVDLACVRCRSRHVRCDATQPACNRCKRDGKECDYKKSRRGGLNKAALAQRRLRLEQQSEHIQQSQGNQSINHEHRCQDSTLCVSNSDALPSEIQPGSPDFDAIYITQSQPTHISQPSLVSFQVSKDRLIELCYENFWPSFPVTLPLHYLQARRLNQNHGMEVLLIVLEWIGSIYAAWTSSEAYYEASLRAIDAPTLLRTPFNVQALMLFAIAQHHSDFKQQSRKTLDLAITIALELRMNERGFAQAYGESYPVLEESWRRTYYFLQIIDQHFSVVINSPVYALAKVPGTVDLPCDDEYYEIGQIPPTKTWREYENREFAEIEVVYSSITYMYDLSRIIAYVMNLFVETGTLSDSLIQVCDTKIAVWQGLLPSCKKDPLRGNGQVDEVMFMAHLSSAIVLVMTHRLFSSLAYSAEELSTHAFICLAPLATPPKMGRNAHTARALKALEISTRLFAIPCTLERHNVFAMSISARLATAQISACNNLLDDHAQSMARDRIRLNIGFLKAMGSIWPLGKKMVKEVQHVARSTLINLQNTMTAMDTDLTDEMELLCDEVIWPIDPSAEIDIFSGLVIPTSWNSTNLGDL
ncbi:hypothetical protein P153DRAFT_385270 [Dothidotthia symphoricarpi CBS 119687]|uniref:Zn(2)-C6 fungal-type domain-containing protein n=1 Tax=Dothidotthia symphoricarpi CBS 119687 TaxID=1392245 RepID=A0A6A6AEP3_9PLEO|nr:uncharacterized protein P153DRAFT_385270 [Dothidotthia symphoricarpi CBS 119687]KAF2130036.1 hypothetical protein P153DRAFT_385270 [Dothidotthia symphoricarpi CBS 119687]